MSLPRMGWALIFALVIIVLANWLPFLASFVAFCGPWAMVTIVLWGVLKIMNRPAVPPGQD